MSLRMSVFGTGYLGATHAAGMAELGHEVIGVDIDPAKIERLARGEVPFFEPGLPELLRKHVESGRLRFTTDAAEAAEFADVHFIGVGTPQKKGENAADMRFVDSVIETLAPLLTRPAVILGKSTVPVGTAARLAARVRELAPVGDEAQLGWNPEFLREGFAVEDTLRPDRLVVGVDKDRPGRIEEVAREVYAGAIGRGTPFMVTDLATAELVKVSANAFLATKISFINAVAEVCEATGADVADLADAIGYDARIGRKFLGAGLGFGGGCLPKDIRAFMARAGELGVDQALGFLREVDNVNLRRRDHVVNLAEREVGGSLKGARIAVLGAAFKPNSDDVRDSPALDIAGRLHLAGAEVRVYDPEAMGNAAAVWPTLPFVADADEACADADLVIVATEWKEFRELDPAVVAGEVAQATVIDGRNCLPADQWIAAGWRYLGLGRYAS
ncbi:UDP-glucose/GDP-mannose dehydrogenase family protein [Demequina sp. SYSU T00039]|uniref:UDP-glucose 6-dehydrogenase n=1 Tax=Demequina lignilytica TaxID=3051663 RepID=A0AAW7M9N8_9MICO|nr:MULTISPECIES: UDP-glucose/GDP-mannose dehydrogenase family protein [unclassified Demequina]MDN4477512.1 UDP-glucose/GDP-mannose dehydrogenase family protein [Demequina sp. SYSU T00039-1]MDN4488137.1 UDP-glucose/GDP-mannose dehydrogenase family protein [Demequina sp. SYSU T00039]MDN4490578.1 UDP-glucose/GDP-mannose dehydrogenase family protein [Demequina sp. SYSU T00068]